MRTCLLVALAVTVATDASAIITRDDVPDDQYVVDDAEFPALVDLFEPGDCIGTLIHPSFLLTVAHCAEDLDVGATLIVAGVDHTVAEVVLHPEWQRFPNDIALVRFDVPVVGVTPYPLYRATDEVGQTLTLVGRGLHATGLEGERGATDDGLLRRANNVVTGANEQWLEVLFEAPSDPGVLSLEGVGAGGDSGGPAFIDVDGERFIAGLNSWGDATPQSDIGKYGANDYSTRVSKFVAWIDGVVPAVPEPEPEDTAAPTETTPNDPGDPPPESDAGAVPAPDATCGCRSGAGGMWWVAAAFLLARSRSARRRIPSCTMPVRLGGPCPSDGSR